MFQRVTEATVNGVKYAVRDVFVLGFVHSESIPMFFQIKFILNMDTQWSLCGRLPICFDKHFHAYEVQYDDWLCVMPGQESHFQALDVYMVEGRLFVAMRHL